MLSKCHSKQQTWQLESFILMCQESEQDKESITAAKILSLGHQGEIKTET